MKKILSFDNIQNFPIWAIALFYLPQSFLGMIFFDSYYSAEVFAIGLTSCFFYFIFFHFIYSQYFFSSCINGVRKLNIGVIFFSSVIFTLYIAITIYAALTTEQVALFSVFKGANIDELAKSRGDFLSTRTGWEIVIPYVYAILKMALVPYAISSLFFTRHRFRFYFLGVFLFSLALTLEKSSAIVALMPIIIMSVNSSAKNKVFGIVLVLILFVGAISFLSRGGMSTLAGNNVQVDESKAGFIPIEYQLFVGDSQMFYILNRVVWIPFATAVDWLKYQDEILKGEYSMGSSIGLVAAILDVPKANLEKEVFAFEWGQNEDETGTSNTVYFIDAFVNFSWFGVILYSAVLAFIVKIVAVSTNIPAKCAAYVSLFYLSFNSLPPILFSGGMIFILLLMVFVRPVTETTSLRLQEVC